MFKSMTYKKWYASINEQYIRIDSIHSGQFSFQYLDAQN